MDKKEINITIPEGYEIDKENSTFEKIVFKKVAPTRWRDDGNAEVDGYFIGNFGDILKCSGNNKPANYNIFATEKQAKRAKAEARISQIMANDERFGGVVTNEEWGDNTAPKYVINRYGKTACPDFVYTHYHFLSFRTKKQRDLFLKENMDLVKDYLMLD